MCFLVVDYTSFGLIAALTVLSWSLFVNAYVGMCPEGPGYQEIRHVFHRSAHRCEVRCRLFWGVFISMQMAQTESLIDGSV